MKNQIEMKPGPCICSSPENDVQDYEDHQDNSRPKRWPVKERSGPLRWYLRRSIDETMKFRFGFRTSCVAHGNGDNHAKQPRPERTIHVLRHVLRPRRECNVT